MNYTPCKSSSRGRSIALILTSVLATAGCSEDKKTVAVGEPSQQSAAAQPVPEAAKPGTLQKVSDLAGVCRPQALQTIAAGLSPTVTVKGIANGNGVPFEGGARFVPATEQLPAFCQVTGTFVTNPETGKTANFLATLPEKWNGKYLQMGCSGHCGQFAVSDPSTPFATITNQGLPYEPITRG